MTIRAPIAGQMKGLSLPLFYGMTIDQVNRTAGKILEFFQFG
jgi:hypothetical protein